MYKRTQDKPWSPASSARARRMTWRRSYVGCAGGGIECFSSPGLVSTPAIAAAAEDHLISTIQHCLEMCLCVERIPYKHGTDKLPSLSLPPSPPHSGCKWNMTMCSAFWAERLFNPANWFVTKLLLRALLLSVQPCPHVAVILSWCSSPRGILYDF